MFAGVSKIQPEVLGPYAQTCFVIWDILIIELQGQDPAIHAIERIAMVSSIT